MALGHSTRNIRWMEVKAATVFGISSPVMEFSLEGNCIYKQSCQNKVMADKFQSWWWILDMQYVDELQSPSILSASHRYFGFTKQFDIACRSAVAVPLVHSLAIHRMKHSLEIHRIHRIKSQEIHWSSHTDPLPPRQWTRSRRGSFSRPQSCEDLYRTSVLWIVRQEISQREEELMTNLLEKYRSKLNRDPGIQSSSPSSTTQQIPPQILSPYWIMKLLLSQDSGVNKMQHSLQWCSSTGFRQAN